MIFFKPRADRPRLRPQLRLCLRPRHRLCLRPRHRLRACASARGSARISACASARGTACAFARGSGRDAPHHASRITASAGNCRGRMPPSRWATPPGTSPETAPLPSQAWLGAKTLRATRCKPNVRAPPKEAHVQREGREVNCQAGGVAKRRVRKDAARLRRRLFRRGRGIGHGTPPKGYGVLHKVNYVLEPKSNRCFPLSALAVARAWGLALRFKYSNR